MELVARALLPAPQQFPYPQLRYRADPLLGFALDPEQRAFNADQAVTINARGLRGPLVPYERVPGRQRLLFLGDSITFGWGVRDDEVVTARVVALLGEAGVAAEAVNTSVPGYNAEQEVTYLEHEGRRYGPDWVIVGVYWNDINDHAETRVGARGELTSGAAGWGAPLVRVWASETGYALRNALKHSRLLWAAREGWFAVLAALAPDAYGSFRSDVLEGRATEQVERGWQHLETSVQRIVTLADRHEFQPLLVSFPLPLMLQRSFPHSSYPARLRARRPPVPAYRSSTSSRRFAPPTAATTHSSTPTTPHIPTPRATRSPHVRSRASSSATIGARPWRGPIRKREIRFVEKRDRQSDCCFSADSLSRPCCASLLGRSGTRRIRPD